jgi:tetratricopeptide (TPR) repeat protein
MPTVTRWSHRVIASAVLVLLLAPSPAYAQRDQFLAAVIRLYQTLPGVFGDEGPQLTAHVEAMSAALARWEDTIRESERQLRPQAQDGNPQTALQAHTVLASLYLERNRFDAALREFDADITIDPARAGFHRLRGLVLQAMNRDDEAAAAFRAAWLREPDDPQNAYRVVVYRSPETTAADVERALGTLRSLERALITRERARAYAVFMNVRAIDDDAAGAMGFIPAAYAPAFTQLLNGDYAGAVVALRSAAAADPLNTDPVMRSDRTTQGIAALKQGLVDSAIAHFEAALGAGESSQAHRLLGTAYWVSGDLGKSVLHLRAAVRLSPRDERSWLALARALESSGNLTEVVDALRTAIGELPDAGALRWQLSVTAGKRQRTEPEDLELATVAERLTLLAGKGELYDRAGRLAHGHLDYGRALTLFEKRVVLTPNNAAAHKTLGRAYIDAGREDEGYAALVIALLLDPLDTETLTALGQLHLMADRGAQAVAALERALAIQSDHSEALHALSDALLRTGRTAEGQKRREESEQLRTKDGDDQRRRRNTAMLTVQAELKMAEKDYAEAIDTWQQVIALEGRDRASHLRLAEAYAAAGRLQEAAASIETAISLKAGPEAHRRLAEVYAALGRSPDSARERQTYSEKRLEELRAGG